MYVSIAEWEEEAAEARKQGAAVTAAPYIPPAGFTSH